MQEEIDRLRALIGPDEVSYDTLLADLAASSADAQVREKELGELRGRVLLLERRLRRSERRNVAVAQCLRIKRGVTRQVRRWFGAAQR